MGIKKVSIYSLSSVTSAALYDRDCLGPCNGVMLLMG